VVGSTVAVAVGRGVSVLEGSTVGVSAGGGYGQSAVGVCVASFRVFTAIALFERSAWSLAEICIGPIDDSNIDRMMTTVMTGFMVEKLRSMLYFRYAKQNRSAFIERWMERNYYSLLF
jgi:hypothetical protein